MSLKYNQPYSDGPYTVTDFIVGGHLFYYIYEFVLTILDHKQLKIEPKIIENRWMDDFDIERIKNMKSHHVDYITNKKGYMEFTIDDENYMGRSATEAILVFSKEDKKELTSVCYQLKTKSSEDSSYRWRHHNGRKFTL